MEYIITKTSEWKHGIYPPCKNAKEKTVLYWGKPEWVWVVEINTLEDLMELQNEHGDIIIRDSIKFDGYKEIVIYDDYME